jgi:hypothetical protein
MRYLSLAIVAGIVIIAVGQGLESSVPAGTEDDERPGSFEIRGPQLPWPGRLDGQVLVGGVPLPQETAGGERRVEVVAGREYELRLYCERW